MQLSIIAAVGAQNFAIGKKGTMAWSYPKDLALFQKLTKEAGLVIMGRKTWESIGSTHLPNRFNVVISSNKLDINPNVSTCKKSLQDALIFAQFAQFANPFVIGGSALYKQAMELDICKTAYITRVPDVVHRTN
jgi:dihydrofolate reductase